jgi:hypothetical protein
MFTEPVAAEEASIFSRLLGVPLLSSDTLRPETIREHYFATAHSCQEHLFLDPDTGLRLPVTRARNHPSYVFGPEAVSIVLARPTSLTLIFDQSLARGSEREQLETKMTFFADRGIASFCYVSHACFILVSASHEKVLGASRIVLADSGLPPNRFVMNANHITSRCT